MQYETPKIEAKADVGAEFGHPFRSARQSEARSFQVSGS